MSATPTQISARVAALIRSACEAAFIWKRAETAEDLRAAQIARETFARETGEHVEPLSELDSLPDWLVQLRAKGRQALHDYFEELRKRRTE
jgi:hypothetical protein